MKLKVTTEHELVYTVQYFQPTEGGMDSEQYGEEMETVEQAVSTLELARKARPSEDWLIVITVNTLVS